MSDQNDRINGTQNTVEVPSSQDTREDNSSIVNIEPSQNDSTAEKDGINALQNEQKGSSVFKWLAIIACSVVAILILILTGKTQKIDEIDEKLSVMTKNYDSATKESDNAKSSYNALQTLYNELKVSNDDLQRRYDRLKEEHDNLIDETKGWFELSDEDKAAWGQWSADEKAAELARAETEKINAENELKKQREEEEKKAAEEKAKIEAEEKKGYETGYTYDDLARRPDEYVGKKVKFKGEVLQVIEDSWSSEIQIRLATKKSSWGGYSDDVIYIHFKKSLISERILEDDIITIYGVAEDLTSYTTVMGAKVTLPQVKVDKIDLSK